MKKTGMVTVFCAVCLALSVALMSCVSYSSASEADSTYSETVNVPGVSAADLYTKVNLWFTDTFQGPPEPNTPWGFNVPWERSKITASDKNKGVIQANYTFFTNERDMYGVYQVWLIYSPVEVQVSDGQYRLVFSKPRTAAASYSKTDAKWIYAKPGKPTLVREHVEAAHNVWHDLASALRETVGGVLAGN